MNLGTVPKFMSAEIFSATANGYCGCLKIWVIEVIGAVDDIAGEEADMEQTVFGKRVDEAHGIIHRIAAILAMEDEIPSVWPDPGDGREQLAMSKEAVLLH